MIRTQKTTALICVYTCFVAPAILRAQEHEYLGATAPQTSAEIFGQGVRETDWQSARRELQGFHLPPGFSIQRFASEPEIAKPLNMAWDRRGRLWVSSTVGYPFPAGEDEVGKDTIKILEDTNRDGVADKVTTFADRLNIPMGLLPVEDGVICFSIPYIWYLRDIDGDDRVDQRQPILGPFDTTRDTHGMVNAMRDGGDGWIYACHGFNNQSHVRGTDDQEVRLHSGNTFRFKADGSRIEAFTHGQVNPFGMTRDEYGNWYSADCHSKPISALIPGACYPSFGRPHDGMGFAPDMMDHLHGSTAISGIAYVKDGPFPKSYRHKFYSGNVMTSRINCNALRWQGATATAVEQADFLTSDDPWFRPVDLQLGPDGALYVADFYNKIIGHYEVPLSHPGRDRTSGRIWRISYDPKSVSPVAMSPNRLLQLKYRLLQSGNLEAEQGRLNLGKLELVDQAEVLLRQDSLTAERVATFLQSNRPQVEKVALLRTAAQWPPDLRGSLADFSRDALSSANDLPHQARAAAELLATLPQAEHALLLYASGEQYQKQDPMLSHTCKIAVRDILRHEGTLGEVASRVANHRQTSSGSNHVLNRIWKIFPALGTAKGSAEFLKLVSQDEKDPEVLEQAIDLAAKYPGVVPPETCLDWITRYADNNWAVFGRRFATYCRSYYERDVSLPEVLRQKGQAIVDDHLIPQLAQALGKDGALDWADQDRVRWSLQERSTTDGRSVPLLSSHLQGEPYVGILKSEPFRCPDSLEFWLAGHNGRPHEPDTRRSQVRLESASTGQSHRLAFPPRSDTAKKVQWNTSEWTGEWVRLCIEDAMSETGYAWLAAGEFSMPALNSSGGQDILESIGQIVRAGCYRGTPKRLFQQLHPIGLSPYSLAKLLAEQAVGDSDLLASTLIEQALRLNRVDLIPVEWYSGPASRTTKVELVVGLSDSVTGKSRQNLIAAIAGSQTGVDILIQLLTAGRVGANAFQGVQGTLPEELTILLQNADSKGENRSSESEDRRLHSLLSSLDWTEAEPQLGQSMFNQHCAACHQLAGQGKTIGPQLDGAVARSLSRLVEDILLPNRNVDRAFQQSRLLMDNDQILTGLVTELPNGDLTLADAQGKTLRLAADQIVERRATNVSLMPANFDELLSRQQLVSLLDYLISRRTDSQQIVPK